MKVLVIGPCEHDEGPSMIKYGDLITKCYVKAGCEVTYESAPFLLRGLKNGKWTGYIDWLIVGFVYFKWISRKFDIVHLVDHSKAYLVPCFNTRSKVIVTCHDMIAIRSAFDKEDIALTKLGKLLQKMCLHGLEKSNHVFSVSETTKNEYLKYSKHDNCNVILSCMNSNFLPKPQLIEALKNKSYIMHIGSNLERKNRKGIVSAFASSRFLKDDGLLVFCGAPLSSDIKELIKRLGLEESVMDVGNVTFDELCGIYSNSNCLVFPSFSEGFGWPILEAQACNTAVICSELESMPEVAGSGALLVDPTDIDALTDAIDCIYMDVTFRVDLIKKGKENLKRFSLEKMTSDLREHLQL